MAARPGRSFVIWYRSRSRESDLYGTTVTQDGKPRPRDGSRLVVAAGVGAGVVDGPSTEGPTVAYSRFVAESPVSANRVFVREVAAK